MFQVLAILGLILIVAILAMQVRAYLAARGQSAAAPSAMSVSMGTLWGRVVFGILFVSCAVLALTGLVTSALGRGLMSGLVLMLHVGMGGLFALAIALAALSFAERCRFNVNTVRFSTWDKLLFWAMLAAGLAVLLTAVLPMMPFYGTHGQEVLYELHRHSSLLTAILVAAQAGRFLAAR